MDILERFAKNILGKEFDSSSILKEKEYEELLKITQNLKKDEKLNILNKYYLHLKEKSKPNGLSKEENKQFYQRFRRNTKSILNEYYKAIPPVPQST